MTGLEAFILVSAVAWWTLLLAGIIHAKTRHQRDLGDVLIRAFLLVAAVAAFWLLGQGVILLNQLL